MTHLPLKVGVTGGIGSGKTVVTKIFEMLGAPVYNADLRARLLMTDNASVVHNIKSIFGEEAYQNSGLNNHYISENVFNNPTLLEKLNAAVHPAVEDDFAQWLLQHAGVPYIIKEAALLFEAGTYRLLDKIITVTAPEVLKIQRVLQRDIHRTREQVLSIMSRQMAEEEKLRRADEVIYNDGLQLVFPQVLGLHEKFLKGIV